MTKVEIIDNIARDCGVERIILAYTHHRRLTYDMQDLCQIIYVALLECEDTMIEDLHSRDELSNYIVGIVKKQYLSTSSRYYYEVIREKNNDDITDLAGDEDEY